MMQSMQLKTGNYTEDEIKLWRAVVLQALLDASNIGIKSIHPSWPEWKRVQIRDEARLWFKKGETDFEDVCHLAQLDPYFVRKFAMRAIRGEGRTKLALVEWRDWFRRPRKDIRREDEHK